MSVNKEESMKKKSLIYFIGNFSSKMMTMIIIPIYAKYLSASDLGNFDFQQTLGNLLAPILVFAIWESILRFGLNKSDADKKRVISTGIIFSLILLIIFTIVLTGTYLHVYDSSTLTFWYLCMIIFMPILTLCQYIVRTIGKSRVFVEASVYSSIFNLGLLLLLVVILNMGLFGLVVATTLTSIINIIVLLYRGKIKKYISFSDYDGKLLKQMVLYSLPLVINLTFSWGINGFSRFYINLELGAELNGIFAFGSKFSGILATIGTVISMAAIEDAVISYKKENFKLKFEMVIRDSIELLFSSSLLFLPLISLAFPLIENNQYQMSLNIIPILLLVTLFQTFATLVGNIFNVFGKTQYIFYTSIVGAVISILLTVLLGSYFAIVGVAIAQLIGSVIMFLVRYMFGRKLMPYNLPVTYITSYLIIYVIIAIICLTSNILLNSISFVMLTIFIIYSNKNILIKILKKILKR